MVSPLARLLVVSCVLSLVALGPSPEAQEKPTGAALADLLARFDAYAESSRQRWGVPGMAVAVVQGDRVVFSKGYGVRVQGEPAPVEPATVFQIGSISKSFTATVMGTLVDEGKLRFEDRVVDRYPEFQMHDPWVTREFLVWDLMAQHSGLAPYAGDSAITIGFTRGDVIKGLRHLRPVSSFRSEFAYVNNLWLVVAALEERATGRRWEDLVAERVFAPLGMTSTSTSRDALLENANAALPHVLVDGRPTPTRADFWDIDAVYVFGPAGGINSTVLDMANYVIAHLHQGQFRGKAILKPETARWLHDPKTIITVKGPANVQRGVVAQGPAFYCQGWLRQLLSPTPLVWHNGGTPGSKAVAAFTPGGDLGVVILSNLDGTELPEALMYYLYDLYYGRPEQDHTEAFMQEARARTDAATFPALPARPAPMRALGAYVGTYRNPYFGPLTAEVQEGRLQLRLGSRPALVRTRHWDGDTFAVSVPGYGPPRYTDGFVTFCSARQTRRWSCASSAASTMPTTGDSPARRTGSHLCYARAHPEVFNTMSFDYGKYFGEIKQTHDLLTKKDERVVAPEAAARRRAPRRRPLPGLQRAAHLAHGPDGRPPSSTGSASTTWPPAARRTAAASSTTAAGQEASGERYANHTVELLQKMAPARGGHVVPVVHPVLRRGARGRAAVPQAPHRRVSRRPPGARRVHVHPAASRPPSRSTITARASRGSARAWPRAGSSRPSRASRWWSSSPTCAGAGRARRR